ncbi:hypothetical protein HN51_063233 [Arachis hypogaea]|uniref:Protein MIZU-KUSSEI n=1 Tax=Arachis hypogaea TaxID=3818 RepID=A0A445AYY5_ARAHY|nr:protein MIZU-KUSSEI 1 [Arachis ipaensis]XP_020980142.1 protein MIZU-KUSSEI 1 [Arachis ipaensis]XP_029146099.1 protein MIZU-KUSSEI 1-like [Arachis hypogaea]XP_057721641.1 protein MIZU-KUSSEI 1 [Arachis stenosperma]RYR31637.1 hypothetical protein Ahy_B01g056484 [Arachis hypogaea]
MKTLLMERTTTSTNSTTSSTSNLTLNSSGNPSQDMSSKRHHFHWTNKVGNEEEEQQEEAELSLPTSQTVSKIIEEETKAAKEEQLLDNKAVQGTTSQARRKLQAVAISKLRSVLTVFNKNRSNLPFGLGPRVVGTLFGYRRGHVHFAFQKDPTSQPAFLIELATPISGLVREMASGLVRIALECDKEKNKEGVENEKKEKEKKQVRLLQETLWRTYCNGKKCGYATRRECGPKDWDILKAVEPISMGAGVLPVNNNNGEGGGGSDGGEVMYMRARFERIVGSRDSEAFYMMNPDSNGAPELSIYLLRV